MVSILRYEFLSLRKSKKLFIIPLVFALFAVISVLTSKYMNQLMASVMEGEGITVILPEPVLKDSYLTYISDLFEIVLFIVIFLSISSFISDKTKGIYPLLLSKPIPPRHYILAKYVMFVGLILLSTLIGYGVFTYYTYLIYDDVMVREGLLIWAMYSVYIWFIASVALLASTQMKSYLSALLVTMAVFVFGSLLDTFHGIVLFRYLPSGISRQLAMFIQSKDGSDMVITMLVSIALTLCLLELSIRRFQQQDLE